MHFVYSDEPAPRAVNAGRFDVNDANPHKYYVEHFSNLLYLDFIARNGTFGEAHRATKEIAIAQRKLNFWSRHPAFNVQCVANELSRLKREWKIPSDRIIHTIPNKK